MQQSLIWGLLFFGLAASNTLDGQEPKPDANSVRMDRRYAMFVERAKNVKLATTSGEALLLNIAR